MNSAHDPNGMQTNRGNSRIVVVLVLVIVLLSIALVLLILRDPPLLDSNAGVADPALDPSQQAALVSQSPVATELASSLLVTATQVIEVTSVSTSPAAPTPQEAATSTTLPSETATLGPSASHATQSQQPVGNPDRCGFATVIRTPQYGEYSEITFLAVRAAANPNAALLTAVSVGESVEVICNQPVEADGRTWVMVRYDAVEGWMSDRFLSFDTQPLPPDEQAMLAPSTDANLPPATPTTLVVAFTYVFPVQGAQCSYEPYHHDYPATDIFCPTGSDVVAPTSGVADFVNRVDRWDPATNIPADRGGKMVAIIGNDGWRYYASHLSDVAPGIEPGVPVEAGQLLGWLGKSGNARDTPPHIHFGISRPTTPDDWQVRRGELPPYEYLQAWQRNEMLTPQWP